MKKENKKFICSGCGFSYEKWSGYCSNCGEWNSLEEVVFSEHNISNIKNIESEVIYLKNIDVESEKRYTVGVEDIDAIFGGGIVKGSISLIGGDPGIGKSTFLLQICGRLSCGFKVLYVSGEESAGQIKLRADRLDIKNNSILVLSECDMDVIYAVILKERPNIVVVDSIQTVSLKNISSIAGSISQIRECTYVLQKLAKKENISIILVGHVNKEGNIAGPKILEHIVDSVFYFEGDRKNTFRILRVVKNRFGSVNDIAVFDMEEKGLTLVKNPSAMLIKDSPKSVSGSCICAMSQGKRPIFAEVQSLVTKSGFGLARRMCKGLDYNKFIIIIAVLEKRVGFNFGNMDCYVNVVGGFKLDGTESDLAISLSLVASLKDFKIGEETVVLGEIGLAGEVRGVGNVESIVLEAKKLGFKKIVLPFSSFRKLKEKCEEMVFVPVKSVKEAVKIVVGVGR